MGTVGRNNIVNIDGKSIQQMIDGLDAASLDIAGAMVDITLYAPLTYLGPMLGFVVFFYALGALYDDRRDRSILFWQSLPISDTETVLSKLIAGGLVAPLVTILVTLVTGVLTLLMFTVQMAIHGISFWQPLAHAHPFAVLGGLLAAVPLYLLWGLPAFGWLLLCSAWARSKPFLWAVALPVGVGAALSWFGFLLGYNQFTPWFWREIVGRILLGVFPGSWFDLSQWQEIDSVPAFVDSISGLQAWAHLVYSPGLWLGILAAAAMSALAIHLRGRRADL